jgi:hypothetical protein
VCALLSSTGRNCLALCSLTPDRVGGAAQQGSLVDTACLRSVAMVLVPGTSSSSHPARLARRWRLPLGPCHTRPCRRKTSYVADPIRQSGKQAKEARATVGTKAAATAPAAIETIPAAAPPPPSAPAGTPAPRRGGSRLAAMRR